MELDETLISRLSQLLSVDLYSSVQFNSVQFSSVQDGIYTLGKAHIRTTASLRSVPNVALETDPMLVSLTIALFRPLKAYR